MFPTARHASYLKTPQFLLDNVPCHTKSLILFKSPKRNTLWLQKSINHLEIAFWDLSSTGSGPMKVDRAPAEGDSSHVSGGRFQESWRDTNQAYYQPSLLPSKPTVCRLKTQQELDQVSAISAEIPTKPTTACRVQRAPPWIYSKN